MVMIRTINPITTTRELITATITITLELSSPSGAMVAGPALTVVDISRSAAVNHGIHF